MRRRTLAAALVLLAALPALAGVYKWKDAEGRTHFPEQAEQMLKSSGR